MVMPLIHEDLPKCYVCHRTYSDVESLRDHQKTQHGILRPERKREAALGDVTIF